MGSRLQDVHKIPGCIRNGEGISYGNAIREVQFAAQDNLVFNAVGSDYKAGAWLAGDFLCRAGRGYQEGVEQDVICGGPALGAIHRHADKGQAIGAFFEEAHLGEDDSTAVEEAAAGLKM